LVGEISIRDYGKIALSFVYGTIGSLGIMLMIYVAFAQVFVDYIEGIIEPDYILSFLILGTFFISMLSSIGVSFLVGGDIRRKSIVYATILSYLSTLGILILISYISLFYLYPEVFDGLSGFDYFFVFPLTIVYFALYVLNNFFMLNLISIIISQLLYLVFIILLYKEKELEEIPKNYRI